MNLLELKNLSKTFGGVKALSNVSLGIDRGEIYGLIGPNGAGKTTLFNVLTGVYDPSGGEIRFENYFLNGCKPHQVAQFGIARTFQNIRLFQSMTVLENVMIGTHSKTQSGPVGAILNTLKTRREERKVVEQSMYWLEYVGIRAEAHSVSKNLSYGDQRRLEIARALATKPKLLALDEPAAGMNAAETDALKVLIQKIQSDGVTVLLIEHDVKLIMNLCDRVAVLDYGEKIAEGFPN